MQDEVQTEEGGWKVVINQEEQYSLIRAVAECPAGWRDAGCAGSRESCLDYINRHWTDMRPASLRGGDAANGATPKKAPARSPRPAKAAATSAAAPAAAPRKRKAAAA